MIKNKYESLHVDVKLYQQELRGLLINAQNLSRQKFEIFCKKDFASQEADAAYIEYARANERKRAIADMLERYERVFEL